MDNLRMHGKKKLRKNGANSERWNWAADEIKKSLRKLQYLVKRNAWEYWVNHIQKLTQLVRQINPRKQRNLRDENGVLDYRAGLILMFE